MRIANIFPLAAYLDLTSDADTYHMFLTGEVLRDRVTAANVVNRLRERAFAQTIILDGDTFETGQPTDIESLSVAAQTIMPDLIVLPDDPDSTYENLARASKAIETLLPIVPNARYMAVPHAKDLAEYVQLAQEFLSVDPRITTIGIIEETEELYGVKRADVVKYLADLPCTIHLLGLSEDMHEFFDPFVHGRVMSVDSTKLVRWGLDGYRVTREYIPPYPGRGDLLQKTSFTREEIAQIRWNIDYWNNLPVHTVQGPQDLVDVLDDLTALLGVRQQEYNGELRDPFGVLSAPAHVLGLPEYYSPLMRLFDKWHRIENVFTARAKNNPRVWLGDDQMDELFLDLAGYAMLTLALYRRERSNH